MANVIDNNIFEVNKQRYKMIAVMYNDSGYVLGLEQTPKSNQVVLATSNIIEFQYVNQLGKLCLEGTLRYVDTEGFISNFINDQYVGLDISIAKQKQESDGLFVRQENDPENQFKHSFIVNNIEVVDRQSSNVVYVFHLVSKQWYNFAAKLDISTYAMDKSQTSKGGVIGLVKECLVHNIDKNSDLPLFNIDATFDICTDNVDFDYITNSNDNVFTAIDYLLDKLFYYQNTADSMKFIAYDEDSNVYKIVDLADKNTFGNIFLIFLSMFKTQEEKIAYSHECNIGTVVRFPKTQLHQAVFAKNMSTYDFLSNNLSSYIATRQNIAKTFNTASDDQPAMVAKLEEELIGSDTAMQSSLDTTNYGAIWQNNFNQYKSFCDELLGDNALMINVDGTLGKHPGDILTFSIEDDAEVGNSNIAEGNEVSYINLKKRYARLKNGNWIIGKIRHILNLSNRTFRQNVVAFQNYTPIVKF